jgi:type IV secretory pathway TraG/TraD family ATPase VirD4
MPEGTPGRAWWGCYLGDRPHFEHRAGYLPVSPVWAGTETATLIIGPPRSGKTSTLIIPSVLDAPAAAVSTSTKPDVLMATARYRAGEGYVYLFDPTGTLMVPAWVRKLRWSPVVGCEQFDRAVSMAHGLSRAARPGASLSESAHWVERAEALLAPLLFAAALSGRPIGALCQWVLARDLREPQAVISESGHELAASILSGVAATDERERSGIFSTAAGLLSAYRSDSVLEAAAHPTFDPAAFAASSDTLYICAPAHEQDQLAPLVVALLEAIRAATLARPAEAAPVLFALDEVANIAPLSSLPALAAEGGGQGLVTLACLQDLSQARVRWGEAAEGFLTLFGAKVILPGVADYRTLSLISALGGEMEVPRIAINRHVDQWGRIRPSSSTSTMFLPRYPIDAIARGRPGFGLLIYGNQIAEVRLMPWFEHAYFAPMGGFDGARTWEELCQRYPT